MNAITSSAAFPAVYAPPVNRESAAPSTPEATAPALTDVPAYPDCAAVAGNIGAREDSAPETPRIVEKIDGIVGNQVRFRVDVDSNRTVLQITDPDTGEVVNTIPSEEMLAAMERIEEARCHFIDCAV